MIEIIQRFIKKLFEKEYDLHNLIIFKTDRQRREWESEKLDQKLKFIVEALALVSWGCFNKHLMITDIYRSQNENEIIYGWNGKGKQPVSTHTYWRAVDIGVGTNNERYTKDEAQILYEIACCIPYKKGSNLKSAVYGIKRHWNHIHLQVS